MKPEAYLKITQAPHLKSENSVLKIYYLLLFSLLPVLISYLCVKFSLYGFRIAVSLGATFLAEVVSATYFRTEKKFYGFHSAWLALLLCFIAPPNAGLLAIAVSVFLMLTLGRDVFGGIGDYPLNPVLIGYLILKCVFVGENNALGLNTASYKEFILWGGVLSGTAILLAKRLIRWELPFLFLGIFSSIHWIIEHGFLFRPEWVVIFFVSFFVLTDYSTMPSTPRGRQWIAVVMGVTAGILSLKLDLITASVCGVLAGNMMTPWIEDRNRPFGSQKLWQSRSNKAEKIKK